MPSLPQPWSLLRFWERGPAASRNDRLSSTATLNFCGEALVFPRLRKRWYTKTWAFYSLETRSSYQRKKVVYPFNLPVPPFPIQSWLNLTMFPTQGGGSLSLYVADP